MLGPWLSAGRDYELFWRLTPAEISKILDGNHAQHVAEMKRTSELNHEFAHLIAFAFHDPKKIPTFGTRTERPAQQVSTEVDDLRVRAYFMGLAGGKS